MPAPSNAPDAERRASLGEQIRYTRAQLGYSIETAAQLGDVGHMTWRRIERGEPVQSKSYFAVDRVFGWSYGFTMRVAEGEGSVASLPAPHSAPDTAAEPSPRDESAEAPSPGNAESTPAPRVGSAAMSDEYKNIVRDIQRLNWREVQAITRLIESTDNMFSDMAEEIRSLINDMGEIRPYYWHYGNETSTEVGERYSVTYHAYAETWNQVAHMAQDAEQLLYHGRYGDLQDLYARLVIKIQNLGERYARLRRAEEDAARDIALQQSKTAQETEQQ